MFIRFVYRYRPLSFARWDLVICFCFFDETRLVCWPAARSLFGVSTTGDVAVSLILYHTGPYMLLGNDRNTVPKLIFCFLLLTLRSCRAPKNLSSRTPRRVSALTS